MTGEAPAPAEIDTARVKQCCALTYESDLAKLLLGDCFHPGGRTLTERLAQLLDLGPASRVLDVAAGRGTSAIHLAERFGCEVVGVDYSRQNVDAASRLADRAGLAGQVRFHVADAERLPFDDASFDAVLCECAFCTFPDKAATAREFARVLAPGGCAGLSDLTRTGPLPASLEGLLSWIACVADSLPAAAYADILMAAGLVVPQIEEHDDALRDLVEQIRGRLIIAEVMVGLKKLCLPGFDFASAKAFAREARAAVGRKELGYAIVTARKPDRSSAAAGR
ncbi:MAG: methyltransferase domain-containing protein [Proteobacteria bacterium]|nr:methyltransferase domain-containing protein [Pseudomonadota bacterium]